MAEVKADPQNIVKDSTIATDGGTYIKGNVNTQGGNFIGRDSMYIENSTTYNTIIQISNVDPELLRQLQTEKERRWFEQYEHLRSELGGGYHESVRNAINKIIDEVNQFEVEGTPVKLELKAKIYRLAAIAYLPRHSGGDEKRCKELVQLAEQFSEGEGLLHCRITSAILLHDVGQSLRAIQDLQDISLPEAQRLRFAILIDTQQKEECQRIVEEEQIDLQREENEPDWMRVVLGYHVLFNHKVGAVQAVERLLDHEPTATNYRVAAFSLLRIAHHRVTEFYQKYEILPGFSLGLDLQEWIDADLEYKAICYYAQAAKLYDEHHCPNDAIEMWIAAIQLSRENQKIVRTEQEKWIKAFRRIAPHNALLQMVDIIDTDSSSNTKNSVNLLDIAMLINAPNAHPSFILHAVMAAATTPTRSIELAAILVRQLENFNTDSTGFTHFVFVVLNLWHLGGDEQRAHTWLDEQSTQLPYSRYTLLFYMWLDIVNEHYDQAKTWLEKAFSLAPGHPEVLVMAHWLAQKQGERELQQDYAKLLFEMARTTQTAVWYIWALRLSEKGDLLIELLDGLDDLPLDPLFIRRHRIYAFLHLRRMKRALPDLEWLHAQGAATEHDHLILATIYRYLHDFDNEISVLRRSLELHPDSINTYIALSRVYQLVGRNQESYSWARKTFERFPNNPDAASNLFMVSHETGYDVKPEVGEALRSLLPGGKFAEQSPIISMTIDEFKEMARLEDGVNFEESYKQGKITRMMLCRWRNSTLFEDNWICNEYGESRYSTHDSHVQEFDRVLNESPRRVVLDYSALLTLWSLFGEQIFEQIAVHFDQILVPETLREILNDELVHLRQFLQPGRHEAREVVREALTRYQHKIVIHPFDRECVDRDITGSESEVLIVKVGTLIYFNEHTTPDCNSTAPIIGIQAMAKFLLEQGEIDLHQFENVTIATKSVKADESATLKQIFQNERQAVVNLQTLVSWAMRDRTSLNILFRNFARLHIAEQSKQFLEQEVASFNVRKQLPAQLDTLWSKLAEAESKQLVYFDTISDSERRLSRRVEEQERHELAEPNSWEWQWHRLLRYYDELVGLATHNSLPIWTDDRFTKLIAIDEWRPKFTFSTDTYLEFAYNHPNLAQRIDGNRYHTLYARLVKAGYYYLPINIEHILLLLQQGQTLKNNAFESLLRYYRESITEFWRRTRASTAQYEQEGASLLGEYCDQVFALFHRMRDEKIPVNIVVEIFTHLDLARHAGDLTWGNEPMFYTMLLLRPINLSLPQNPDDRTKPFHEQSLIEMSMWLHEIILASGITLEVLQESWYSLLNLALQLYNQGEDEVNRLAGKLYASRMMVMTPDWVLNYLFSTDIGAQLQNEFVTNIQEVLTLQVPSDQLGIQEVRVSLVQWQRDFQQAVNKYLDDPIETPISHGIVTIKTQRVPSSIFLYVEALPTEIYKRDQDAYGVPHIYCLLDGLTHPTVTHRETLWKIGMVTLEEHNVSTIAWEHLHDDLLGEQDITKIGVRACTILLSEWSIVKSYIEQACTLTVDSIGHLLSALTPDIVRGWLKQPTFDWASGDGLIQWAAKNILISEGENVNGLLEIGAQYGYSLFPDAPIIRDRVLKQVINRSLSYQEEFIDKLLVSAKSSISLTFKANSLLFVFDWLNHHRHLSQLSTFDVNIERSRYDDLADLLTTIFKGQDATPENNIDSISTSFEMLLGRWLAHHWQQDEIYSGISNNELTYLSTIAGGLIADALLIGLEQSQPIIRQLFHRLRDEIASFPYADKELSSAQSFYHPAIMGFINCPAAFMLHGLISTEIAVDNIPFSDSLKNAALYCGVLHQSRQTFLAIQELPQSFLDRELSKDIPASVLMFLSKWKSSSEIWSEKDILQIEFLIFSERAILHVNSGIDAIADMSSESDILQRISWVFQGEVYPTTTWFDFVRRLLEESILEKIRNFPQCYGELVGRIGLLSTREGIKLELSLAAIIHSFLVEVPKTENLEDLVKIKALVLSNLLTYGDGIGFILQWLEQIADLTKDDFSLFRSALHPFIANWSNYTDDTCRSLHSTVLKLSNRTGYKNLWEFKRVKRDFETSISSRQ